jgi:hypothetical protein
MPAQSSHLRTLLFAISIALAACGGDATSTTAPSAVTTSTAGTVSFSFTNGAAGSFSASGSTPTTNTSVFGTAPWATGVRDDAKQALVVVGIVPKTSTTWDFAMIRIKRLTVGSNTIIAPCADSSCTGLIIAFESNQGGSVFTLACVLTSGTVSISSLSSTRATGTFSGSGTCAGQAGATSAFTVTGGTFDVPVVPGTA